MISVKQLIQLTVGATLLWRTVLPVNAQESNSRPIYTDPPPRVVPLPSERPAQVSPLATDFQVGALQSDYTGSLWVGSHQGLARINPATGVIQSRVNVPNRFIDAMTQDRVGRIWLGTYDGLVRVDPRINQITAQNFRLPSNRVLDMVIDGRGFLWVGTDHGLAMASPYRGL